MSRETVKLKVYSLSIYLVLLRIWRMACMRPTLELLLRPPPLPSSLSPLLFRRGSSLGGNYSQILAQSRSVQVEQAARFSPASVSPPPPPGTQAGNLEDKPAAAAAAAAVAATRAGPSPSQLPGAPGEGKKKNDNNGLDHREEEKGDDKDGVDHGGGRVSSGSTIVPMEQDGSGEYEQGGSERVHDELEEFSAGVDTGDETCNRVATVLRMLYLSDLRTLQDEVNAVLAMAQTGGGL